jgi:hypothetical protein
VNRVVHSFARVRIGQPGDLFGQLAQLEVLSSTGFALGGSAFQQASVDVAHSDT